MVNVIPVRPTAARWRSFGHSYGGGEPTTPARWRRPSSDPGACSARGGVIGTNGYIQMAPWQRGPVDVNSATCTARTGCCWASMIEGRCACFCAAADSTSRATTARHTRSTATRLWRYAAGARLAGRRTTDRSLLRALRFRLSTTGRPSQACYEHCPMRRIRTALTAAAKRQRASRLFPTTNWAQLRTGTSRSELGSCVIGRCRCARCARLGPRADLWHDRSAYQSARSSARFGSMG